MKLCKFGVHEWSEWYESCLNKYRFIKEATIQRDCKYCGERESFSFSKKGLEILQTVDNSTVDGLNIMHYNGIMKNIKLIFSKRKPERNKKILELRQEGMTLRAIGKRFKISQEAVRKICDRELKKIVVDNTTVDKKRTVCYTGVGK